MCCGWVVRNRTCMLSNQSNKQPKQKTCPHSVNLKPLSETRVLEECGVILTGRATTFSLHKSRK